MKSMKSKKDFFLFLQEAVTQNNSLSQSKNTQNEKNHKKIKTSCQWKEIKKKRTTRVASAFMCPERIPGRQSTTSGRVSPLLSERMYRGWCKFKTQKHPKTSQWKWKMLNFITNTDITFPKGYANSWSKTFCFILVICTIVLIIIIFFLIKPSYSYCWYFY